MKKIKLLALVLLFSFTLLPSTVVFAAPERPGLTDAQRRECDRLDGRQLNTQARRNEFRDSRCARESYCALDGNTVLCGASLDDSGNDGDDTLGSVGQTIEGCGDIKTSGLIKCETRTGNPIQTMLLQIVNFLAIGVGIAVVGGIVWGGMLYASSNGDSARTKQGITVIVNAVIGLLLFIFMYAIINYLVPGGLFT